MEQNTIGSMPNEAIAEENESQKIPCVGHYCEGTLKRPSTLIHYQMVHCNPLNGSFIKHSRFRVWCCVSSQEHNCAVAYWEWNLARNLHEALNDTTFSLYPMEDYETSVKRWIQEIRTIIGILFMMETESFSTKLMKPSIPKDEEQYWFSKQGVWLASWRPPKCQTLVREWIREPTKTETNAEG